MIRRNTELQRLPAQMNGCEKDTAYRRLTLNCFTFPPLPFSPSRCVSSVCALTLSWFNLTAARSPPPFPTAGRGGEWTQGETCALRERQFNKAEEMLILMHMQNKLSTISSSHCPTTSLQPVPEQQPRNLELLGITNFTKFPKKDQTPR